MSEWEEKSKAEVIVILYNNFLEKHRNELVEKGKEWSHEKEFLQFKERDATLYHLTLGEEIAGIDKKMNISIGIKSSIGEIDISFRITPEQIIDLFKEMSEKERTLMAQKLLKEFLEG